MKNKEGIIYDFYAVWCGPCKMIMPKFEEMKGKYPYYEFKKVNVDEEPKLVEKYDIHGVPTFVVERDGEILFKGNFTQLNEYLEAVNL